MGKLTVAQALKPIFYQEIMYLVPPQKDFTL